MVSAADQLASSAGIAMLDRGGTAGDAMVAAAAVMAVVGPHLCGLGGDVLAMVKAPGAPPRALLSVGRAGSGADPDRLRAEGHEDMPLRGNVASVPVPGAVDGWLALHERYGRLGWDAVLEPAIALAADGFAASLLLAFASHLVAQVPGASQLFSDGPLEPGRLVRLPGVARTLRELAGRGREGFYGGEFGRALLELGGGEYTADDLARPLAQWADPLVLRAFGHDLWTVPPPSQGYVTLAGAWIADQVGIPDDPADPLWPHLLAEAGRAAGFDRPSVLYDGADGAALLSPERLGPRASSIDPGKPASPPPNDGPHRPRAAAFSDGDTTHLCAVDADGLGISLTQSNALDFGAHLARGRDGDLPPQSRCRFLPRARPSRRVRPAPTSDPHALACPGHPTRRLFGPGHRDHGGRRPTPDHPGAAGAPPAHRSGSGHRHLRCACRARGARGSSVPSLARPGAVIALGVERS